MAFGQPNSTAKVYRANLSQTGTNAPVATVFENTLGGTLVWARGSTGEYTATLNGNFTTAAKVGLLLANVDVVTAGELTTINSALFKWSSSGVLLLKTAFHGFAVDNLTTTDADDILVNTFVQILEYP
jgi:hypothetical protein